MTKRNYLSIRSCSVWTVIFGNITWLLLLVNKTDFFFEDIFLTQSRIIFLSSCLSTLVSYWLFPKVFRNNNLKYAYTKYQSEQAFDS